MRILTIVLALLATVPATAGETSTVVRTCARLNTLSDAEIAAGARFDLEATVTFANGTPHLLVDDGSAKAFLFVTKGVRIPSGGDVIRASGTTGYNQVRERYARVNELKVIGRRTLPPPRRLTLAQVIRPENDRAAIQTSGSIIDAFKDETDSLYNVILLKHNAVTLPVFFFGPDVSDSTLRDLIGAEATLTGVYYGYGVGHRRHLGPHFEIMGPDMISAVRPASTDPQDVPDLEELSESSPSAISGLGKHRVSGRVLATWQGNSMMVKTAKGQLVNVVLSHGQPLPAYGASVSVTGFPETDFFRINLSSAVWQAVEDLAIDEDAPVALPPDALVRTANGQRKFSVDLSGRAIRLRGHVKVIPPPDNPAARLLLESGTTIFPVDASSLSRPFDGLASGDEIEATGIVLPETDSWGHDRPFPRVREMVLVIRDPKDIRVLIRAPWWTPFRLTVVIAILLAVLLGIFVWNRLLRRLVERRSRELMREEIAHATADLKVEERTRLAVEIHDTVVQNLTGVALQIEAAQMAAERQPDSALPYLQATRLKMQSCIADLRNCLWDLRSRAFEETWLADAIRRTVAPHAEAATVALEGNIACRDLSDNIVHTVLCIVRELVINAVRHGQAKKIVIAVHEERDELSLTVSDDGVGFDPDRRPGLAEGHFGLQGIAERVRRFGGALSFDSAPGKGCAISITGISVNG